MAKATSDKRSKKTYEDNGHQEVNTPCATASDPAGGSADNKADRQSDLDKTLADRIRQTIDPPTGEKFKPDPDLIYAAEEILEMDLGEPRCIVEGLVTEGLNILVSRPKLGKTWWAMQGSIAVASGTLAFGRFRVMQGNVLYLAMEDNFRRIQSRLRKLLGDRPLHKRLDIKTSWERMDKGGLGAMRKWMDDVKEPRMVVIDVIARLRSTKASKGNAYADDYADIAPLQELAAERPGLALVPLHHDRKAQSTDALDDVSGSIGIPAVVDNVLLMRRERGKHSASIRVHGRDMDEQDWGFEWDPKACLWTCVGDGKTARLTEERQAVLKCIREHGPLTPTQLGTLLDKTDNAACKLLMKLTADRLLTNNEGTYALPQAP